MLFDNKVSPISFCFSFGSHYDFQKARGTRAWDHTYYYHRHREELDATLMRSTNILSLFIPCFKSFTWSWILVTFIAQLHCLLLLCNEFNSLYPMLIYAWFYSSDGSNEMGVGVGGIQNLKGQLVFFCKWTIYEDNGFSPHEWQINLQQYGGRRFVVKI